MEKKFPCTPCSTLRWPIAPKPHRPSQNWKTSFPVNCLLVFTTFSVFNQTVLTHFSFFFLCVDAMTPALVTRLKSDLNAKNTAGRLCRVGITTDAEDSPQNVRSVRSVRRPKRAFRLRVRVRVDIGCCRKWACQPNEMIPCNLLYQQG